MVVRLCPHPLGDNNVALCNYCPLPSADARLNVAGLGLKQHHSLLCQRLTNIDYALIAAASKQQRQIALRLHKPPIDQHVYRFEQRSAQRVLQQLFVQIPRIAPYSLRCPRLYHVGKRSEALRPQHRVATRKGYIQSRILDICENLIDSHIPTAVQCPRPSVVAPLAAMHATGAIDGGAQTDTVHRCTMDDVEHTDYVVICGRHGL